MTALHRFQRYSGSENVATNNALYFLREVSRESARRFRQLISTIWDGVELPEFGLGFHQQVRGGDSVPDGFLLQDRICFVLETKLSSSFDPEQIRRHCNNKELLATPTHRYALLLFGGSDQDMAAQTRELKSELAEKEIRFAAISFAALIGLVRKLYKDHHEDMLDLVDEFEEFCQSLGLLPQDEWTVFVPPCGESYVENHSEKLYYCPSSRSIQPARYLGIYYEKAVRAIGIISRIVVDPEIDMKAGTVHINDEGRPLTEDEVARIVRACKAADQHGWPIDSGHKFFLCDELPETEWRKGTPYGIQNRRYLNLKDTLPVVPGGIQQLADALRKVEWA